MSAFKIFNLAAPTAENDAVTKKFMKEQLAKHPINIIENLKLNIKELWFRNTNAIRMNAKGNEIDLITSNGIYFKSGETFLLAFNKDKISAYRNQIKHLATPTDDNDAATKSLRKIKS